MTDGKVTTVYHAPLSQWIMQPASLTTNSDTLLAHHVTIDSFHEYAGYPFVESSYGLPVRKVGSSNPSRIKLMIYRIDNCNYLAWCSVLIGSDQNCLVQHQDNVTVWDIMSWCRRYGRPVGQHYKVAMSAYCHESCYDDYSCCYDIKYHKCALSQILIWRLFMLVWRQMP